MLTLYVPGILIPVAGFVLDMYGLCCDDQLYAEPVPEHERETPFPTHKLPEAVIVGVVGLLIVMAIESSLQPT